jgi:hypothetical protein
MQHVRTRGLFIQLAAYTPRMNRALSLSAYLAERWRERSIDPSCPSCTPRTWRIRHVKAIRVCSHIEPETR